MQYLECIIEKVHGCKNNPENSFITKVSKHIPSGFSVSTVSSFRSTENNHNEYRGKDCRKSFVNFWESYNSNYNSQKKKNKVINKRAARILWKYKNVLYL